MLPLHCVARQEITLQHDVQILECARTGLVPDTGPPVSKEQEAALRPMCDRLKVSLEYQTLRKPVVLRSCSVLQPQNPRSTALLLFSGGSDRFRRPKATSPPSQTLRIPVVLLLRPSSVRPPSGRILAAVHSVVVVRRRRATFSFRYKAARWSPSQHCETRSAVQAAEGRLN
jgi:hypothetical protein